MGNDLMEFQTPYSKANKLHYMLLKSFHGKEGLCGIR